jgi:hypothetical protein
MPGAVPQRLLLRCRSLARPCPLWQGSPRHFNWFVGRLRGMVIGPGLLP